MLRLIPKPFQKIKCEKLDLLLNKERLNQPIALIKTCQRALPTLQATKSSLKSIGFKEIEVFYDSEMKGSIWAFKEASKNILSKYEGWLLLCEDDVIFSKSTYKILDKLEISINQTISLFITAEQDTLLKYWGWNKVVGDFHVSVAYYVHTDLLKKILNSKTLENWPQRDRFDKMWSLACQEIDCDFIMPRPSLAQHIGETSTINKFRVLDFRRVSFNFRPEL